MNKLVCDIFEKEKINNGRQHEVDLLRGFTLIIICICHAGLFLTVNTNSFMYYFADLIGSEPAAPVFMMLMGLSVAYSRKNTALDLFKRGIILFIESYLLNIIRSFPYFIVGELDYFASIPGLFVVDILQFAGLSFLLFALFKKLKMPCWSIFIVSIIFLIVGEVLMAHPNTLEFSNNATYILNLFLPLNNDWCCFNLLTWFVFPSFGLCLGELLIRCKNKNRFYFILLLFGLVGTIALYLNIGLRFPNYTTYYYGNNYYRMGILNSLIAISNVSFLLAIWYYIEKILPEFLKNYLSFLSKNITVSYILSWIFLAPIIHIQAYYNIEFNVYSIIVIMLLMVLFCSLFSWVYKKVKLYIKNKI